MKRIDIRKSMLALLAVTALGASAVRSTPFPIETAQPDGTPITIRLEGDERFRAAYTLDGDLIMKDSEGFYCYATVGEDGYPAPSTLRVRPMAKPLFSSAQREDVKDALRKKLDGFVNPRYIFTGNAFPAYGEPRALVVLIEFADKKFTMEDPHAFFDAQLNGENYTTYGATGSAREYFVYNSRGIFKPHFDVLGPVKLENGYAYYGKNTGFYNEDAHPDEMIVDVLKALDADNDFSVYDHNNDGFIDNVFGIYAGYGEADGGGDDTIWPHSADLTDMMKTLPEFDGVKANRYGVTCELDYSYRRPDGIGTFVHEFSHVLGLPDLYNTNGSSAYYTPGEWSVLDYGPYNNKGRTPPNYSIHERYALDWMKPKELKYTGDYTLEPIDIDNDGYIIPTSKDDEFFLVECRQLKNNDAYIPNEGMLVWHIDFVQKVWDANTVNNTRNHQYVDLVEADGKPNSSRYDTSSSGDSFPGSKKVTSFGFNTVPALKDWSGKFLGVEFSDIRLNSDGTVSFHIDGEDPSGVATVGGTSESVRAAGGLLTTTSEGECAVYDLTGRRIGTVSAGSPLSLHGRGLYIVTLPSGSVKVAY